jgi:hypothetical protein
MRQLQSNMMHKRGSFAPWLRHRRSPELLETETLLVCPCGQTPRLEGQDMSETIDFKDLER